MVFELGLVSWVTASKGSLTLTRRNINKKKLLHSFSGTVERSADLEKNFQPPLLAREEIFDWLAGWDYIVLTALALQ